MTARDKTSPLVPQSGNGIRDEFTFEPNALRAITPAPENEMAAASERFAVALRTAQVEETVKTAALDFKHMLFCADERPLWASTFESEWHRYIGTPARKARTTH